MSLYMLTSGAVAVATDVNQIVKLLTGGTGAGVLVGGRVQAATSGATSASGIMGGIYSVSADGWTFPTLYSSATTTVFPAPPPAALASFSTGDMVSDWGGVIWLCVGTGVTNTWDSIGNGQTYIIDRMYTAYPTFQGASVDQAERTPVYNHDANFNMPSVVGAPFFATVVPEVQTGSFSAFFCMTPGYYFTGGRLSAYIGTASATHSECDIHIDQNDSNQPYGSVSRTTGGEHFQAGGSPFESPGGSTFDLVFHDSYEVWTIGMTIAGLPQNNALLETVGVSQSALQRCFNALMWTELVV